MNVLILYDLEGVIGVTDLNDTAQNSKLMETEINMVVETLKGQGIEGITICEVHNGGNQKLIKPIWENVAVIYGISNVDFSYNYDLAFLLGFHTRSGMRKYFSHTMRPDIKTVWFGEEEVGEIGLFTYWLRNHGITVTLCSGEGEIEEEAELLELEYVITDFLGDTQELYKEFQQKIKKSIKIQRKSNCVGEGEVEIIPINQDFLEEMKMVGFRCNERGICFVTIDTLIQSMNWFCEGMNKAGRNISEKNQGFIRNLKCMIIERQIEKETVEEILNVPIIYLDSKKRKEIWDRIAGSC